MKLTAKELLNITKEVVEESNWRRVKDKIDSPGYGTIDDQRPIMNSFIIMSADRSEIDGRKVGASENSQRYESLKKDVKASGYPYTRLQGKWIETDSATGERRTVIENSLMIEDSKRGDFSGERQNLFELAKDLSRRYNQEAFIFGELLQGSVSGQPVRIMQAYDASGQMQNWGGPWTSIELVMEDEEFWSRVRGDNAQFQLSESKINNPKSMMSSHLKSYKAKRRGH